MGAWSGWHWLVLALVVLLLFGFKKMPDMARAVGRSMRILKAETKGLREDDVRSKAEAQSATGSLPPREAETRVDADRPADRSADRVVDSTAERRDER
jgi:sec-independent protein translocase protein TatA